jgi:acyl carrier protein phosphodiesterase
MNFLAHAYLSGEDEKLMAGNFFADFVKGRQALKLVDPAIARGIALHRQIDAFTDTHRVVAESKKRLKPKYRHYSAVIVDVFYDHFLARNWLQYHQQPLDEYVKLVYKTINRNLALAPGDFPYMFQYMEKGNWLLNYGKVEGIGRSLSGMAQRTMYESKMDEAVQDLVTYYEAFNSEFKEFFPELITFCLNWRAEHPS